MSCSHNNVQIVRRETELKSDDFLVVYGRCSRCNKNLKTEVQVTWEDSSHTMIEIDFDHIQTGSMSSLYVPGKCMDCRNTVSGTANIENWEERIL